MVSLETSGEQVFWIRVDGSQTQLLFSKDFTVTYDHSE